MYECDNHETEVTFWIDTKPADYEAPSEIKYFPICGESFDQ